MKINLSGTGNIYLQIAETYKRYIHLGVLKDGEKLPSCRVLALELGVNPNTVERAYAKLENEGYIQTFPKRGVYVNYKMAERDNLMEIMTSIKHFKALGIPKEDIISVINKVYGGNAE